jgi:hypothetical protein
MRELAYLEVLEGIGQFRPRGECSLVDTVELIRSAIEYCRERKIPKLLVDTTGLTGLSIPSLVDRFLAVEEWAEEAQSMVTVVLVAHAEYIHPEKFGVKVAADFGLMADVYTSEPDALKWLSEPSYPT